ncbi:MAG: sensor histidine kinase [Moraxellaceae bacterium]
MLPHSLLLRLLASLWLMTVLVAGSAHADNVTIGAGEIRQNLGRHLEYYFDPSGTMTLDDVRRLPDSAFKPSHYDIPNFSFTPAHVWLRFKVQWQAPDRRAYIVWQQYPLTDHFTFYRPDNQGGYQSSLTGDQYPFAQRELPTRAFGFFLQARPGETDTYYMELHGAGTINVDLQLTSLRQGIADTETRHLLMGLYYGGLVALLLFNLILFFTLRESIYLYYTLYGVGLGLAFFDVTGLAFRYFWPETVWMNTSFLVFVFISMHAQAQFTRKFLNLKQEWRLLDRFFLTFIVLNALTLIAVFFAPDRFLYPASQRLAAVIAILCMVAGAGLWWRGYKPARYFTAASGFYVSGMLVYVMQNFGVLPTSVLSNYSVQIGSSLELILFSFALADRINHMKDEKSALEAAARQQLLEHNQTLESKVHERTQDLLKSLRAVNEKHEALMAAQQQLVQSEKMSSLGGLVAGVAHEINNPANFTRLAAENLERDILRLQDFLHGLTDENSDPQLLADLDKRFGRLDQQLSLIHDGTQRLSLIVSDLRSFSRLDESETQIARPDDGLAATLNLVRAQYGNSITIELQQENMQATGFCHPAALNQVFMNLAVNACQAITERARQEGRQTVPLGTLHVQTRLQGEAQDCWLAEFRDDGNGMDAQTQQRIFEPFFTTKDVGSGTGLGLSVSYGIVRKHDGEIIVESAPGQGSCFRVCLPLKQQAAGPKNADKQQDATQRGEEHGTV